MKLFRKYYIPGIFSLVFLPLVCFWYFEKRDAFRKEYILPVCFWNKQILDYRHFNNDSTSLKGVIYEKIQLNNTLESFNKIEQKIILSQKIKDPDIGLHVLFSPLLKIDNYIKFIDFLKQNNIHVYSLTSKEIWLHHFKILEEPEKDNEIIITNVIRCYGPLPSKEMIEQEEVEKFYRKIEKVKETAWYFKYSIGLFIMMIFAKQITKFSTRFY